MNHQMSYHENPKEPLNSPQPERSGLEIAVIGMAGRFPGARSVDEFWQNLRRSVESIAPLDDKKLLAQGVSPELLADPNYIKVGGTIEDTDLFDAAFFGFNPREAEILDPQQRLFLETAVEALETAGYDPERYPGSIGVYGGAGMNGYLLNLYSDAGVRDRVTPYELFISNDKDFLTTRVSYKLNLKGPSVDVQTACSSSLVAVHMAGQSLLSGECDMALAGGVAVSKQLGYRVQAGSIYAPDGHCRAFDADAAGTVSGNGVGIVVLKRLEDALAEGDTIDAVIKGSAVNNDGALKVSYTAPCVEAQAAVIQAAHTMAEVSPQSISYVEAHGTGTALGDPIEISALTQAFNAQATVENSESNNSITPTCAIGSVKTNIGHLDAAAGISGLIKTVLALKYKQIPASLHFQSPNPNINFNNSPFYVNTALTDWSSGNSPRRAGVSSFGIGGTNAHIVLEEAVLEEAPIPVKETHQPQILVLSAKTPTALDIASLNLADYLRKTLEKTMNTSLAEVAYTLQFGRSAFDYRRSIICQTVAEAIEKLHFQGSQKVADQPSVVFSFSGQGSQHVNMAKVLYENEPIFKEALAQCAEILANKEITLLEIIYPNSESDQIHQTVYAQPALFAVEYALAQLWISWGVNPTALIGHSVGEYVAACLAGVFDLHTALQVVSLRGQLMQKMPSGAMLSVALSAEAVAPLLNDDVTLSVSNGPQLCVVSGTEDAITSLQPRLEEKNIGCHRLHTSHAFHSPAMEPVLMPFVEALSQVKLSPPAIPFISTVTGTWITADEATDPDYWGRQIRQTVRFSEGVKTLSTLSNPIFLEVGPDDTLTKLAQQHFSMGSHTAINSLPHPKSSETDISQALLAAGQLWSAGVRLDWEAFHGNRTYRRIPLPTYPFERQRYWVEFNSQSLTSPSSAQLSTNQTQTTIELKTNLSDWFYSRSWQRSLPKLRAASATERPCWLIFTDDTGIGQQLAQQIEQAGQDVFTVCQGDTFEQAGYRKFSLNWQKPEGFQQLLEGLQLREMLPTEVVYLWSIQPLNEPFITLMELLQAFSQGKTQASESLQVTVITESSYNVVGSEVLQPEGSEIQGLCQVVGQEYPSIGCRQVDIVSTEHAPKQWAGLLWKELQVDEPSAVVAYRHRHRWQQTYQATYLADSQSDSQSAMGAKGIRLHQGGLYVIVGTEGLGEIWTEKLREHHQADVVRVEDTDKAAIEVAIKRAVSQFGELKGVFVCSPMTNEKSAAPIALLGREQWQYNCEAKKVVLENLAIALQSHAPDFCCVQSSLSSIIGGLGLAAYSGANHSIDALVTRQNQIAPFPWFSINWDAHTDTEAKENSHSNHHTSFHSVWGNTLADFALTPTEVWQATERILTQAIPGQTIVSKGDLLARHKKWIQPTPHQAVSQTVSQVVSQAESQHGTGYSRPQLSTAYVAPRNELEETISAIWKNLLGIEKIGVNDSFFDLGGHSLLAIQVISRLRDAFPVAVEMRNLLFEAPTIAKIAAVIAEQLPQQSELDEMAALLAEVQTLSTEQAQAQLTGGDVS